jgi:hypothetical protein
MDTHTRGHGNCRGLRIAIGLALVAALSGCSMAVEVGDKCEGLEQIGYSSPVSKTDLDDIKYLGFAKCAKYLEESGLVTPN